MIDKCCCLRILLLAIAIISGFFLITSRWLVDIPGVTDNEDLEDELTYAGIVIIILVIVYLFCFFC